MSSSLSTARLLLSSLQSQEHSLFTFGCEGRLTLANMGQWAEDLAACRRQVQVQREVVERLELENDFGPGSGLEPSAELNLEQETSDV